jgi:hypothetical protein
VHLSLPLNACFDIKLLEPLRRRPNSFARAMKEVLALALTFSIVTLVVQRFLK